MRKRIISLPLVRDLPSIRAEDMSDATHVCFDPDTTQFHLLEMENENICVLILGTRQYKINLPIRTAIDAILENGKFAPKTPM